MKSWSIGLSLAALVAAAFSGSKAQATGLHPVGADLSKVYTIGDLIANTPPTKAVHIIFVHGIRAEGPGTAQVFMKGLCENVKNLKCPDLDNNGDFIQAAFHTLTLTKDPSVSLVFGKEIWPDDESWRKSQPFVLRYRFAGVQPPAGSKEQKPPDVIVDEVNWWPILFALKCRYLVATDAMLAGPDKQQLNICYNSLMVGGVDGIGGYEYGKLLKKPEYDTAMGGPVKYGGGALINQSLKTGLMDWGISDAVIALGPMKTYIHQAINGAFQYADNDDDQLAVVSESLGSFVVLDSAYNAVVSEGPGVPEKTKAQEVLEKTNYLYFFANQFALLEMGRISGPQSAPSKADAFIAPQTTPVPPTSALTAHPLGSNDMMARWAGALGQKSFSGHAIDARLPDEQPSQVVPKQIVPFHDPDDLLTYLVPGDLCEPQLTGAETSCPANVNVFNILDENIIKWYDIRWFNLVKNPLAAHVGHSQNKSVLKFLFSAPHSGANALPPR